MLDYSKALRLVLTAVMPVSLIAAGPAWADSGGQLPNKCTIPSIQAEISRIAAQKKFSDSSEKNYENELTQLTGIRKNTTRIATASTIIGAAGITSLLSAVPIALLGDSALYSVGDYEWALSVSGSIDATAGGVVGGGISRAISHSNDWASRPVNQFNSELTDELSRYRERNEAVDKYFDALIGKFKDDTWWRRGLSWGWYTDRKVKYMVEQASAHVALYQEESQRLQDTEGELLNICVKAKPSEASRTYPSASVAQRQDGFRGRDQLDAAGVANRLQETAGSASASTAQ